MEEKRRQGPDDGSSSVLEHRLVHRVGEVRAGLDFAHGEGVLVLRDLVVVLQEHPVGELDAAPGGASRLPHPPGCQCQLGSSGLGCLTCV